MKALVSFYYSANCPYSAAFRPVLECLPKFFPTSLRFIAIDHAQLPTTLQLNHGVLSTPVVRVSVKVSSAAKLHTWGSPCCCGVPVSSAPVLRGFAWACACCAVR